MSEPMSTVGIPDDALESAKKTDPITEPLLTGEPAQDGALNDAEQIRRTLQSYKDKNYSLESKLEDMQRKLEDLQNRPVVATEPVVVKEPTSDPVEDMLSAYKQKLINLVEEGVKTQEEAELEFGIRYNETKANLDTMNRIKALEDRIAFQVGVNNLSEVKRSFRNLGVVQNSEVEIEAIKCMKKDTNLDPSNPTSFSGLSPEAINRLVELYVAYAEKIVSKKGDTGKSNLDEGAPKIVAPTVQTPSPQLPDKPMSLEELTNHFKNEGW